MSAASAKLVRVIVAIAAVVTLCESFYVQWEYSEIPRPPKKLVPCEMMVDVTNDLAYRTLYYHSIANRNNFAFSPTALTSVLIALYEGSNGRSSLQIQNALGLPWSRDVVRIGYRDILRRLRTYFYDQENPLMGLSLNKEDVTITREYEMILKFYGYDLGPDMISPSEHENNTETSSEMPVSMSIPTTTPQVSITDRFNVEEMMPTTTATPTTTHAPEVETTTAKIEAETVAVTEVETTTEKMDAVTVAVTKLETTTAIQAATTVAQTEGDNTKEDLSTIVPTTEPENEGPTTTESEATEAQTTELPTSTPATTRYIRTFRPFTSRTTAISETTTELPEEETTVATAANVNPAAIFPARRRPESIKRGRRSVPFAYFEPNLFELPYEVPQQSYLELEVYNVEPVLFSPRDVGRNHVINHIFYLNPHESIQTTFKIYNSVLNYCYIDKLKSSALELELDSKDYSLLMLIPDHGFGLEYLIPSLKSGPPLRVIRQGLQHRWVQALIPDFQMKGTIYLTNDMQFLGISDIFEPLRADFSPMTDEGDIYVRHIEQSMNVRIRTKPIDQLKRDIGPVNRPIQISANRPFLFFIVDKELDVATVAGSVLNPLNVRIH